MTEAKKRMPLFKDNLSLTRRQYEISRAVIELASIKFFQVDFDKLKSPWSLKEVQKIRLGVERKLAEKKLLNNDELLGLQLATLIAPQIDLIYYHKLKGNIDQLKIESDRLMKQINHPEIDPEEKLVIDKFLEKHPLWRETLDLIKTYALNQIDKTDNSNGINKAATSLAKRMGVSSGPKLFFLPEEENEKVMGDRAEKKTFVPQLLFTLPVGKNKIHNPLNIDHGNLFYEFVVLQSGSGLKWEQSALAIDGGALLLINNFIGNYEEQVNYTARAAKKHKINISKSEIWQTFIDLLLYHEIGHSKAYPKTDKRMGPWAEWLANSYMYGKILKFASGQKRFVNRQKIIFMLMSQVDLTKKRLKDSDAEKYINSELLFLHLMEKNGLINFDDSSFYPNKERISKLRESIVSCRNYKNLKLENDGINEDRKKVLINFWQRYFEGNDK
jgi:hypothetical protein